MAQLAQVRDARPGDTLFFSFSGYGLQVGARHPTMNISKLMCGFYYYHFNNRRFNTSGNMLK